MKPTDDKTTDQRAKEALKTIKNDPKVKQQVDAVLKKLVSRPER